MLLPSSVVVDMVLIGMYIGLYALMTFVSRSLASIYNSAIGMLRLPKKYFIKRGEAQ